MWEFNPEGPRTIQHFFGMTLDGMCKLFFGPQVKCPDTTEDAGLSCNRLDAQVSNLKAEYFIYIYHDYYSNNSFAARNGSTRRRESGVRRHFLKARLVQPLQRCWTGRSAKSLQGKAKERAVKPNFTHYTSKTGESLPPLRRIVGKGKLKPPPRAGGRGPPPKTWRRRCTNKGRRYHQGALPRRAPSPRRAHQRAIPPSSCKLIVNSKVGCFSEIHNRDFVFCSPASSSSQQSSSLGIFLRR